MIDAKGKKLWLRLAKVCNNGCIFCHDQAVQDGTMSSLDDAKGKIMSGKRAGYSRIVLSGGEATLHPDLARIIGYARSEGFSHIQLITNGRMLSYDHMLRSLVSAGLDEITFSFHGHTPALHDAQTGRPGSFLQSLRALRLALGLDAIVSLDIVANGLNYRYLPAMIRYFRSFGVREFDLLQVIPFGRAWENWQKLKIDPEKFRPRLLSALRWAEKNGTRIWTNRMHPPLLEGYERFIQPSDKLYDETRGEMDIFEKYLQTGVMPFCRGERCQYCFLEDYCRSIIAFRQSKKIRKAAPPPCLEGQAVLKEYPCLQFEKNIGLEKFTGFYIEYLNNHKSLRCVSCRKNEECAGANLDFLIKYGFAILNPIP